jgi:hypothetical protein
MMSDKVKMWNGGTTNETKEKAIREWNKMIRNSEDYVDTLDIEKEFNPRDNINKNMDKPAPISGGEPRNRHRRPEGDLVSDNNE